MIDKNLGDELAFHSEKNGVVCSLCKTLEK